MATERRLIDANALSEVISSLTMYVTGIRFGQGVLSEYIKEYRKSILKIIDEQPTVDAVEVVHAHWKDGCAIHNGKEVYKSIDCSHCNEIFKTDDREYWKARFKVCPFCGAKMDLEV